MPGPKIAILGAGPAGLTLARLLQQSGIACTIYEGEKDRHTRNQGGTLDLHSKAGQRALKEAGLFDEFLKYARPEGECDKIVKADGKVLWDENQLNFERPQDGELDKPEIDRVKLREILLDSLEPGVIQWGRRVSSVQAEPENNAKYVVHFANGSTESDVDLVVGADGAWSKVRFLVTDVKPHYSGITGIELWALNVSEKHPWLSEYVGQGSCFMFDEGRAIIAQRQGDDSIRVYACVRQPEHWSRECGIDWSDHDAARRALVEGYFNDCSDDLKPLVLDTSDELIVREMYMLPVGITWKSRPGVTLIGDSAHLMTPFAGVGVNVALTDALVLAQALISRKDSFGSSDDSRSIAAAIEEYETFMFDFSKNYAEKTFKGLQGHFSAGGGDERAAKFKEQYRRLTGIELGENAFKS